MAEVMNSDLFWSRVEEDGVLARDLIGLFFTECPGIFSNVRVAVEGRNPLALKRAAHAVKGLVANFSAAPAVDAAAELEEMGRSGNMAEATEALAALDRQLVLLRSALARFEEGIAL